MEELFVTEKSSKLLKGKEFNEKCTARFNRGTFQLNRLGEWYDHNSGVIEAHYISAPLYDQVEYWLENKGYFWNVFEEHGKWILMFYTYGEDETGIIRIETWKHKGPYGSKRDAKEKGIEEILKLI